MDRDQIIHDLAILYLQKTTDNLTPDEMVVKYKEAVELYKVAYKKQSKSKATVLNRSDFGI